uniref:WAP four-disulfide core domain 2 n=1 Tax=Takifugu rubripes TaxID=31033 RepID=A0A3B5K6Q7_TAKRU
EVVNEPNLCGEALHVCGLCWLKFFSDSDHRGPGECPRELEVVPSRMGCEHDGDCHRGHKCCKFKCGPACVPPILSKSPVCPWNYWGPGPCIDLCRDDSDCPDPVLSKCCSNGCGHQCTEPYIVKTGLCGPPKGAFICAEYCAHDGHCPGNQKCCRTTCGHACSEPC